MRISLLAGMSVALFACSSDTTPKTFNDNPEATITSHSADADVLEGYLVEFRAQVSDSNDSADDLEVSWYVGATQVCDWAAPTPSGETACETTLDLTDSNIIVEVRDPDGAGGRDEVALNVVPTFAPDVQILSPTTGTTHYSDQLIAFKATLSDGEDAPGSLQAVWESVLSGELDLNTIPDSNGEIEDFAFLPEGQHAIKLHVTDLSGKTTTETVVIAVGGENTAPVCGITSPLDGAAIMLGDSVIFQATANDADIPATDLTVTWESDRDGFLGNSIVETVGETSFIADALSTGNHVIAMRVADEIGTECIDTILLEIYENSAPTIDSVSISPLAPSKNDTITCDVLASDVDGDIPVIDISWSNLTTGEVYPSATLAPSSATLDLSAHGVLAQDVIECMAVATDSYGEFDTAMDTVAIVNSAPVFGIPATISPSVAVIDTPLSCSATAIDPDGGSVIYSYTWLVNGQTVGSGPNFVASASQVNVGDDIVCMVVAIDSDGESASSTSAPTLVENTLPVISTLTLDELSPDTNGTIGATVLSVDPDGQSVIYTYQWHVIDASAGGADVVVATGSGTTISDVTGLSFDRDDEVYLVVTPNDGVDDGLPVESDHAVVLNTAPTAPTVSVTAAVSLPMEGIDDLNCSVDVASTDLDNDAISYSYAWYDPAGQLQQSLGGATVLSDTFLGSGTTSGTWTCEVVATDGDLTAMASAQITVDSEWDGPHYFSHCGQSGRFGPTQAQCDSDYAGSVLSGAVTVTDGYQYWTVPHSGLYEIELAGAQGAGAQGGYGAMVIGEFSLVAGDVLKIIVGQQGLSHNGQSTGGGGGSFVAYSDNTPLIIGGGGAGGINGFDGDDGVISENSSQGRNNGLGLGGQIYNRDSPSSTHGSGGAGFYGDGQQGGVSSPALAFVNGGHGSTGDTTGAGGFGGGGGYHNNGSNVGGGGGGYTGGHGNWGYDSHSAGGGGSYNAGSNPSGTGGANGGNGYVVIDKL